MYLKYSTAMDQRICKSGSVSACRPYAANAIEKATAASPNATQLSFSLFRMCTLQTYLCRLAANLRFDSKKSTRNSNLAHMQTKSIFSITIGLCLSWLTLSMQAQTPWNWVLQQGPDVSIEGDVMPHPFTGGMRAPQWSPIDMDGDGDEDLFMFDRDGSRILVFERTSSNWIERPDWSEGWPEMRHWVLLRDFNCDGLPDLFTGFQNNIYVWENTGLNDNGAPSFEPYATPLMASWDFGTGAQDLPVICPFDDKPAIWDIDNDGDLDFVAFTETSTRLYRFTGQAACGLDLVCTNRCYAMVSEGSEDNTLFIGDDHECNFNVADPEGRPTNEEEASLRMHAGGAITALQLDGEQGHDLLISDVSYPNISGLFLESAVDGQDSTAWVDYAFPALISHEGPADSVDLERFPAAYPIDVDTDGDIDLIFSPNIGFEIDDDRCVQLWTNNGTAASPIWSLEDDNFIQNGTIDVGRGAIPKLVDLDGDGDLDLVVGNKERYEGVANTPSAIALFENIGTNIAPSFKWKTWNAIDLTANNIESAFPALGDLDDDGDLDLLLGDELGYLHQFENIAGPGAWPIWELEELSISDINGETIDVGQFAAPQFMDIDGDGELDLIIGEKNGSLQLYLHCITEGASSWCLATSEENGSNWAGIQANQQSAINGYSTPCLYQDGAGVHVMIGNELGAIQYYGVLNPAAILDPLVEITNSVGNFIHGTRSAASFADVNGDEIPEMLIGIHNGGVRWHQGSTTGIDSDSQPRSELVYPNPAKVNSFVRITQLLQSGGSPNCTENAQWVSLDGRTLNAMPLSPGTFATPGAPGLYILMASPCNAPGPNVQIKIPVIVLP